MQRGIRSRIESRARRAGLSLSEQVAQGLADYCELLFKWNERISLTSLEDPVQAVDRLLIEPLLAARHLPVGALSLLDVGSGGGSPAIPLKIADEGLSLWMVESKTRKAAFLREAIRTLGLKDARVEVCRYEELLGRAELHEALDMVTLRAVRVESKVLMSLQAFLRPGGAIFLFRGPSGREVGDLVPPPLVWEATYPLVEWLRSRLVVVRKREVGRPGES